MQKGQEFPDLAKGVSKLTWSGTHQIALTGRLTQVNGKTAATAETDTEILTALTTLRGFGNLPADLVTLLP